MWDSLEIVKLIVAALVPLSVAALGWSFTRLTKRLDATQWINQKLVEKRITIVDQLASDLNDLYCYYLCVGNWKDLSPADIITRKRRLDRLININRPYLSEGTETAYEELISELFLTYAAPGSDARLRTTLTSSDGDRSEAYTGGAWQTAWSDMLDSTPTDRTKVRALYSTLISKLASEVGAGEDAGILERAPLEARHRGAHKTR